MKCRRFGVFTTGFPDEYRMSDQGKKLLMRLGRAVDDQGMTIPPQASKLASIHASATAFAELFQASKRLAPNVGSGDRLLRRTLINTGHGFCRLYRSCDAVMRGVRACRPAQYSCNDSKRRATASPLGLTVSFTPAGMA